MYCNECLVVARAIKAQPEDDPVVTVRPNEERFIFSVEVGRPRFCFACFVGGGIVWGMRAAVSLCFPTNPTTNKRQTTGALTAEQVVETALEILLDKVTNRQTPFVRQTDGGGGGYGWMDGWM